MARWRWSQGRDLKRVFATRVSPAEAALIQERADAVGCTPSALIRALVVRALSRELSARVTETTSAVDAAVAGS